MDKARQLVDQGNKHRVVVLNEDGKSVFDIPLTVAVVGGIIVFPATAVGVIAALATRHSIVVESVTTDAAANGGPAATDTPPGAPPPTGVTPDDETTVTPTEGTRPQ